MNAMGKYDLIFSELSPNVIICQKMPSNLSLTLRPERTISNRRKAASHFLKTGQVYEGDFMQILIFNFKVDLCPEIKDSRPFKKEQKCTYVRTRKNYDFLYEKNNKNNSHRRCQRPTHYDHYN